MRVKTLYKLIITIHILMLNLYGSDPLINSTAVISVNEDNQYEYLLKGTDLDGDSLVWSDQNSFPDWLQFELNQTTIIDNIGSGGIYNIYGIDTDPDGNLYYASPNLNQVFKRDISGNISVIAGNGEASSLSDGGLATSASVYLPWSVTWNDNKLYIAEKDSSKIRVVDLTTNIIETFATISGVVDVAFDDNNNLYASVWLSSGKIVKFDASNSYAQSDFVTGLNYPWGIDYYNNEIYIAEPNINVVKKIDIDTKNITTIVGTSGSSGSSGDGQDAKNALLNVPMFVRVDTQGRVFIADRDNYKIRIITTDGIINTYFGSSLDTPFDAIEGIAIHNDTVYVADRDNRSIVALSSKIVGIPTNEDVGNHDINLTFSDGNGGVATQNFTLTVVNTNDTPTITGTPNTIVNEDSSYSFTPSANDVDTGDTLVFSIINKPSWAEFNTTTGKLSGTPTNDNVGTTSDINITVTDSVGAQVSLALFDIEVVNTNDAPLFETNLTTQTIEEDTGVLSFEINASDIEGDEFNISIESNNTNILTVSKSWQGLLNQGDYVNTPLDFNLTTVQDAFGMVKITIRVDDGEDVTTQSFDINITDVIDKPLSIQITSTPNTSIKIGVPYIYKFIADFDMSQLDFNNSTLPSWLHFDNKYISTFVGGSSEDTFAKPFGIDVDSNGNIYVADSNHNQIKKITPSGIVSIFAGSGEIGFEDGNGLSASFNMPLGLSVDSFDNIYVADYANHMIRMITQNGDVTTIAGIGSAGDIDGDISVASFNYPTDIVLDSNGSIFVSDFYNHKIRKISKDGTVSTFAGSGKSGKNDGIGENATFYRPNGLAIDNQDNIYVADYLNHLIRKITPNALVSTYAGNGNNGFYNSNNVIEASFSYPTDLTFDNDGNLYVADYSNHKIRLINTNNEVSTYAGSGLKEHVDNYAMAGSFKAPASLVFFNDTLYVSDFESHSIRKITKETNYVMSGVAQSVGSYSVVLEVNFEEVTALQAFSINVLPNDQVTQNLDGTSTIETNSDDAQNSVQVTLAENTLYDIYYKEDNSSNIVVYNPSLEINITQESQISASLHDMVSIVSELEGTQVVLESTSLNFVPQTIISNDGTVQSSEINISLETDTIYIKKSNIDLDTNITTSTIFVSDISNSVITIKKDGAIAIFSTTKNSLNNDINISSTINYNASLSLYSSIIGFESSYVNETFGGSTVTISQEGFIEVLTPFDDDLNYLKVNILDTNGTINIYEVDENKNETLSLTKTNGSRLIIEGSSLNNLSSVDINISSNNISVSTDSNTSSQTLIDDSVQSIAQTIVDTKTGDIVTTIPSEDNVSTISNQVNGYVLASVALAQDKVTSVSLNLTGVDTNISKDKIVLKSKNSSVSLYTNGNAKLSLDNNETQSDINMNVAGSSVVFDKDDAGVMYQKVNLSIPINNIATQIYTTLNSKNEVSSGLNYNGIVSTFANKFTDVNSQVTVNSDASIDNKIEIENGLKLEQHINTDTTQSMKLELQNTKTSIASTIAGSNTNIDANGTVTQDIFEKTKNCLTSLTSTYTKSTVIVQDETMRVILVEKNCDDDSDVLVVSDSTLYPSSNNENNVSISKDENGTVEITTYTNSSYIEFK